MLSTKNIELTIERLGIYGEGIGYFEGLTLFVDGALPGEVVSVSIYEEKKRYARAKVVEILKNSPHRAKPPCAHFGRCGGCQLMHLSYEQQLEAKRMRVVDALERIGKLSNLEVHPCIPSSSQLSYRNKIQLPVSKELTLGLYAPDSHDLIEIDTCHIHGVLGEQVFQSIKQIIKSSQTELRHVLIKTAFFTSQVLVVLVTNGTATSNLQTFAEAIMSAHSEIKGVVQNINTSPGNVILSNEYRLLAGEATILEKLCGLFFHVSAASFFQVNPPQAEKLYQTALKFAALRGSEIVLDAYCGVGTMALIFSKQAKEVIGVECVSQAIADAEQNAKLNAISNAKFICAKAEEFIGSMEAVDVAILNPPRKGCEAIFLEKLSELQPKRIVYVSCDPATLARDLSYLISKGYHAKRIQPFDMFPQTAHVETVALLTL